MPYPSTSDIRTFGGQLPRYVVGNWYVPFRGVLLAGGALANGSIRLIPFHVTESITISELGARVGTLSAGGFFQLGIYASRVGSPLPGAFLGATASISTAATGTLSGPIVGSAIDLEPGLYWAAVNQDNAVSAFTTLATTSLNLASIVGSASVADVLETGGATSRAAMSFTAAFGSWPDLSNSTLAFASAAAAVAFKVSGVG